MKIQLKYLALIMLCIAVTFPSCNEKENDISSLLLLLLGAEPSAGEKETFTADGVTFKMAYVPGGKTFPTGVNDNLGNKTVSNAYWIGETEVTYELWSRVYSWATTDAGGGLRADGGALYTFANIGRQGGAAGTDPVGTIQHPVTTINWRSAMAWCNALTEWYNAQKATTYSCVYYTDSGYVTPIRSVDDTASVSYPNPGGQDDPYVKSDAGGFRLLTANEWELAARYIDGTTWLYGDHASGDQSGACYNDGSILGGQSLSTVYGNYAVYAVNSGSSTAIVKSKTEGANSLGLYDMTGNVNEWCFDWYYSSGRRWRRGGYWLSPADADGAETLRVGLDSSQYSYNETNDMGFRLARTK